MTGEPEPLRRSLVAIGPLYEDANGCRHFQFICDCASATNVTLGGAFTEGEEFAVTCNGCGTSHWFSTVKVA